MDNVGSKFQFRTINRPACQTIVPYLWWRHGTRFCDEFNFDSSQNLPAGHHRPLSLMAPRGKILWWIQFRFITKPACRTSSPPISDGTKGQDSVMNNSIWIYHKNCLQDIIVPYLRYTAGQDFVMGSDWSLCLDTAPLLWYDVTWCNGFFTLPIIGCRCQSRSFISVTCGLQMHHRPRHPSSNTVVPPLCRIFMQLTCFCDARCVEVGSASNN